MRPGRFAWIQISFPVPASNATSELFLAAIGVLEEVVKGVPKRDDMTHHDYGPPPLPTPTVTIHVSDSTTSEGQHTMQLVMATSGEIMEPWYAFFFSGPVLEGSATSDPGVFGYTHSRAGKLPEPEKSFVFRVRSIDWGVARWLPGREIKLLQMSRCI